MNWFETLTGFKTDDPPTVRDMIRVNGTILTSCANGRVMDAGTLTTPSLAELRKPLCDAGPIKVHQIVADIQDLHADANNAGALFQVASQFNLLEMISPDVAPEDGIARYGDDKTQGPACAIACGAGTIWRNYFVPVGAQRSGVGQNSWYQLDMLADLGSALGNENDSLWEMRNGYPLAQRGALEIIAERIANGDSDSLKGNLRIGLQTDTDVTLPGAHHQVSQAYCSALPVAYSPFPADLWKPFAKLVLDAAYEATFHAALQNKALTGSSKLFLTLLGGGAFGNPSTWIVDAIARNITRFAQSGLDVAIVCYGATNPALTPLVTVSDT